MNSWSYLLFKRESLTDTLLGQDYVKGLILMVLAFILWSIGSPLVKLTNLTAYQVSFWRSCFAFFVLLTVIKPVKIVPEIAGMISAISYGATLLFITLATKLTTTTNVLLLHNLSPLFVLLFNWLLFGKKPYLWDTVAVVITVFGLVVFFSETFSLEGMLGMFWAVLSSIAYAIFILFTKRKTNGHYAEPLLYAMFISIIVNATVVVYDAGINVWTMLSDGLSDKMFFGFAINTSDSILVAFLGVFQIGIPSILFAKGLQHVIPLNAALLSTIEPVILLVWAYAFIGSMPTSMSIVGAILILFAIIIYSLKSYVEGGKEAYNDGNGRK